MNTLIVFCVLVVVVGLFVAYEVVQQRRDRQTIIRVLKASSPQRGLDLVHHHNVGRARVYIILASLEDQGLVERYGGDKPPYLYRWVGS